MAASMNRPAYDPRERAEELMISRALGMLDRQEEIELDSLLQLDPSLEDDRYELVAASLDLALDGDEKPMPTDLRNRLQADADVFFGVRQQAEIRVLPPRRAKSPRPKSAGWSLLATAAVVLLMVWVGTTVIDGTPTMDGATLYDTVVAKGDLVRWDWTGTEDPTVAGPEVSGDVVWSSDVQQGVMKIGGLAANDPDEFQYQLWIFDQSRDERYPVDGGVFDVAERSDEVFVPISATLPVDRPYLFAITVEKPGGVMVSSRERIAFVAQPPAEEG